MQVADTEQETDAPDQTPGPVEGLPADAVATKSESFLLPDNAMVRLCSSPLSLRWQALLVPYIAIRMVMLFSSVSQSLERGQIWSITKHPAAMYPP